MTRGAAPKTEPGSGGPAGSLSRAAARQPCLDDDAARLARAPQEAKAPPRSGAATAFQSETAAAASSLDTKGTTRPIAPLSALQNAAWDKRTDWLGKVDELTKAHRERRALDFEERGRRKALGAANEHEGRLLVAEDDAARLLELELAARGRRAPRRARPLEMIAPWHKSRADGQRRRAAAVLECGEADEVQIACQCCGDCTERGVRCGVRSLCRSCRGALRTRQRSRFMVAQRAHADGAARDGLLNKRRRGGRWSGKFVTLTAPHRGDVRERIDQMKRAFPLFARKLRARVRSTLRRQQFGTRGRARDQAEARRATAIAKQLMVHFAYLRNYEWTSGADNLGHPHVHFWVFGPYLDKVLIRELWRGALNDAARAEWNEAPLVLDDEEALIVDVRSTYGDFAQELIKYMTKDIADVGGGYVEPEIYAVVYESFDGVRVIQGSRGLMAKAEAGQTGARCGSCGTAGAFRVRIARTFGVPDLTASTDRARAARYEKVAGRPPPLPPPRALATGAPC